MRCCRDCGVSIEDRHRNAQRCGPCGALHNPKAAARDRKRLETMSAKRCACGAPVRGKIRSSVDCDDCARLRLRRGDRVRGARYAKRHPDRAAARAKRNNQKRNAQLSIERSARRAGRACACGAEIGGRYHNARSCEACTTRREAESKDRYEAANPGKVAAAKATYVAKLRSLRPAALCGDCGVLVKRPRKHCAGCGTERRRVARLVHQNKRRLRLEGDRRVVSEREWRDCLAEHDGRCAYCLRPHTRLTMDHVVAVSAGGLNEIGNIVPACKSCNSRKGNRPIWLMLRQSSSSGRIGIEIHRQLIGSPGRTSSSSTNSPSAMSNSAPSASA